MAFETKLQPKYGSQKSFYGKAKVSMEDGKKVLYSYGTKVAEIDDGKARVFGLYSNTTTRHIKEFLNQNGFKVENSKQIIKDYGSDKNQSFAVEAKPNVPTATIYDEGDVRVFNINEKTKIYAQSEKTRDGFRHVATLIVDGQPVDKATAHYQNRTWESYEYESVINKLIGNTSYLTKEQEENAKKKFAEESHKKVEGEFRTIANVASLGEVFADTKKDKNAWKLRMIKAGLGNRGFEVPDDWDKLSEDEKEKRLDLVIKTLKKDK